MEYGIYSAGKDSIYSIVNEFTYPEGSRYFAAYIDYSPDGKDLLFDVETVDRKTRKLLLYDIVKKEFSEVYSESDAAWFEKHSNSTVFLDSVTVLFESEISGYNNLYSIKTDGTGFTKIAGDSYTILESEPDLKNKVIYFTANANVPYNYNLYKVNFDGSGLQQLTTADGDVQELRLTPDGDMLFYTH